MGESGEVASLPTGEELVQLTQEEENELELELASLTMEDLNQKEQAVQTDKTSKELGVSTESDWETQVAAIFEYSSQLAEQYDSLMKKQGEAEAAQEKDKQQLQKKMDEATRQHKALLEKVNSVRVKLQLNNSKATRKNFLAKKQEMMLEKNKGEEECNRLTAELEDWEKKLTALTEEQGEEQRTCQEELDALKQELERLKKEEEEAELQALQDEIAAVEMQRDTAMAQIEAWLREVEQYLSILSVEFPQQYHHERHNWEKKEGMVRRNQAELRSRFQEILQQLQQGREFESLPRISMPSLPQVPMADLKFSQVMQSLAPPPIMFAAPGNRPFAPPRHPHFYQQQQQQHPQYRQRYHYPRPQYHQQPHYQPPLQVQPPSVSLPQFQPHIRAPQRVTPPLSLSPSPPVVPSPPPSSASPTPSAANAPAGKLDKVLEKLGARYPQCNRVQLMSLLQQVKSSRGTLAGMSMEEVIEQVGLKLAQSETTAPGTAGRLVAPGPIQRPAPSPQKPAAGAGGGQVPGARKLCLMCQNHVDPESRHPLSCSHTIHKDCIRVWLQTSKNNSCPFCLGK
ncbi:uncharacterized protein V6R79_009271 [Siganus canaliculatus]